MKRLLLIVIALLLIGCTKQPYFAKSERFDHVSDNYFNSLSDELECTWLDFAKPTQSSIVKPFRFSRNGFISYSNCMKSKGYYKP